MFSKSVADELRSYEKINLHIYIFPYSMEDILQPVTEARDLMEQLAAEEQRKSMDRVPGEHILRGPLLGRMELVKQMIICGLEDMGLEHG